MYLKREGYLKGNTINRNKKNSRNTGKKKQATTDDVY